MVIIIIIIIIMEFVSLYLIARVAGQHQKPVWDAEASLLTPRIEQ
jgi:hypothetical protein